MNSMRSRAAKWKHYSANLPGGTLIENGSGAGESTAGAVLHAVMTNVKTASATALIAL